MLLEAHLEIVLYLNLKSNIFISDSKGKLEIALTPHLERKMTTSDIISNDSSLKFKIIT